MFINVQIFPFYFYPSTNFYSSFSLIYEDFCPDSPYYHPDPHIPNPIPRNLILIPRISFIPNLIPSIPIILFVLFPDSPS